MTIFHYTLRGVRNVLVFRHILEISFLDIFWQVYEHYSRKTTKDGDVIFSPVVDTCKFCQIRLFVMMWLHMEPLQPISNKKDVLCQAKKLEPDTSCHSIHIHHIYQF